MAWWNPVDYATEGVKEVASRVGGYDYDARDPSSPYYGEQKSKIVPSRGVPYAPDRAITQSEYAALNRRSPSKSRKITGATTDYASAGGDGYAVQAAEDARRKADLLAQLANQEGQIQSQLGRLGRTADIGYGNIDNAFKYALNRLDQQRGVAERDYRTNTADTVRSFLGARNDVASQTRARLDAIRSLLGTAGSGASSAAQYAAPYAVVREGTQRLSPVQSSYAMNRRNLDTAWQDTEREFGNNREDLGQQRFQQRQGLQAGIQRNRVDLLEKLNQIGLARGEAEGGNIEDILARQAGRQRQIDSILDEIVNLGRQYRSPVLRIGDVEYSSPELDEYAVGDTGEIGNDLPGAGDIDPYLLPILNPRDEEDLLSNLVA